MDYESVINLIDAPNFKEKEIVKYQQTGDIIKDVVYCFKHYNGQAKPVADKFGTGNIKQDGKNIWNFLRKNITYKAEPENDQTSRSFSRIIHDKWGDCKHSALVASSIGWNEGYNVTFRIVRYVDGKKDYLYHVYTILEDKNGKQVIVDPLQDFDFEKEYDKKIKDCKAIQNMALTRLTGTHHTRHHGTRVHHNHNHTAMQNENYEAHQIGIICGISGREIIMTPIGFSEDGIGELEELQGISKKTKAQRKEKRKEIKQKIKTKVKKGGKIFKKVSLAPVRGAFSALLLVNFHHLASRMQKAIEMGHGDKITAFAKKFGYSDQILKSQIKKGSTKKGIAGINSNEVHNVDGIGVVVTAAALTTASVAVAAALQLLKSIGLGKEGDDKKTNETFDNIEKGGTNEFAPSINLPDSSNSYPSSQSSPSDSGSPTQTSKASDSSDDTTPEGDSFFSKIPTPVLWIGGIGIAYIAGKKFKIWQ